MYALPVTLLTVAEFPSAASAVSDEAGSAALAVAVSVAANMASMAVLRYGIMPYSACDIVQQADANLYL